MYFTFLHSSGKPGKHEWRDEGATIGSAAAMVIASMYNRDGWSIDVDVANAVISLYGPTDSLDARIAVLTKVAEVART